MIRSWSTIKQYVIQMSMFLLIAGILTCCTANKRAGNAGSSEGINISVPVTFSPNGDGQDDTWEIDGLSGYPSVEISLYTVYGQLVYTSTGEYHPWNGIYKRKPVPAGKYFYVIKKAKKKRSITGWMEVII